MKDQRGNASMNSNHISILNKNWLIIFAVLLFISGYQSASANLEIFTKDSNGNITALIDHPDESLPLASTPILFVHGHFRNFQETWLESVTGFTSFGAALTANSHLGIKPYFINFQNNNRSIVEDALEISQAVDIILGRHNSNYNVDDPDSITQKIVIIAYSKGTISTRLYLKTLYPLEDEFFPDVLGGPTILPDRDANFRPVSEFIAISPPNHGLKQLVTSSSPLSVKQLNNGYGIFCQPLNDYAATDFIAKLNGHPIQDTHVNASLIGQNYPNEAPGSRSIEQASDKGILYVTFYSEQNRDLVGGDIPSEVEYPLLSNCPNTEGRKLAKNLANNTENFPINAESIPISTNIPGSNEIVVHRNTVHACEVIYRSLYTATHHQPPSSINDDICISESSVPEIPRSYAFWYRIFTDWRNWFQLNLF